MTIYSRWENPYHYIDTYEKWLEFLEAMEIYCMNYWLGRSYDEIDIKDNFKYIVSHSYIWVPKKWDKIDWYIDGNTCMVINLHVKDNKGNTLFQTRKINNCDHCSFCWTLYPSSYEVYVRSPWRLFDHHDENMKKIWSILDIPKNLLISHELREKLINMNYYTNYRDKRYYNYFDNEINDRNVYNLHAMVQDFRDMRKDFRKLLTFMNQFKNDKIVGSYAQKFGACLPYIRKHTMSLLMNILHNTIDDDKHTLEMIMVILKAMIDERKLKELSYFSNNIIFYNMIDESS